MKKGLTLCLAVALLATVALGAGKPGSPESDRTTIVKTYPVGDLVVSPAEKAGQTRSLSNEDFAPIIELLTSNVAPGTWREGADPSEVEGAITPFFLNLSLIIRHTPEAHADIATLLRQIRRLPALQAE